MNIVASCTVVLLYEADRAGTRNVVKYASNKECDTKFRFKAYEAVLPCGGG